MTGLCFVAVCAAAEQEKLQAEITACNGSLEAMTVEAAGVLQQQEALAAEQGQQEAVLEQARQAKDDKTKEVRQPAYSKQKISYFSLLGQQSGVTFAGSNSAQCRGKH